MRRFVTPLSFVLATLSLGFPSTFARSRSNIVRSRSFELVNQQTSEESSALTVITYEKDDVDTHSEHKSEISNLSLSNEQEDVPKFRRVKDIDHGRKNNRHLEHNFKYEPKPYYRQYQSRSSITKGQKIGLVTAALVTVALAIYSCVLRFELSTLNVYSLLGMHTDTEQEDEEKVGDAYGRTVEMN